MVEYLPSKHKALSSTPVPPKQNKRAGGVAQGVEHLP
jgi:hypothetical protein